MQKSGSLVESHCRLCRVSRSRDAGKSNEVRQVVNEPQPVRNRLMSLVRPPRGDSNHRGPDAERVPSSVTTARSDAVTDANPGFRARFVHSCGSWVWSYSSSAPSAYRI